MSGHQKITPREWKQISRGIDPYQDLQGSIEEVCRILREKAKGLKDAEIEVNLHYDEMEATILGWVRKSQEEIDAYDKRKQAQSVRSKKISMTKKQKIEAEERKELERLSKKYPEAMNKV